MPAGARHGQAGGGTSVNDRTAVAALHHQAHAVFAGEVDTAQVDVVRALPDIDIQFMNRRIFADQLHGRAGVEHVKAAVSAAHLVEGGLGCRITPYFRADITVGYRDGMHLSTSFNDLDADFSAVTGMVNGYWDIANFGGFTPYVGIGLGVSANTLSDVNLPVGQRSNTVFDFAYALMAGFSYDVSDRVTFDAGYRYIELGAARADGDDPIRYQNVNSHDVRVGLRYNFE